MFLILAAAMCTNVTLYSGHNCDFIVCWLLVDNYNIFFTSQIDSDLMMVTVMIYVMMMILLFVVRYLQHLFLIGLCNIVSVWI